MKITKIATIFGLLAAFAFGQTALTSTTVTSVLTANQNVIPVASASGITAMGAQGQYTTLLYIDHELIGVRSISGLNLTVDRGLSPAPVGEASRTTHRNAARVWIGPPAAFTSAEPYGQCVRSSLVYVPVIVVSTGHKFDCLGLTTAGAYARTDAPGTPVLGATVASAAGVLSLNATIATVSGTAAITGITVPAGFEPGMTITIIPSGAFTWTTATNIAVAGTAVVNRAIVFTWSGTAWIPSYV